jgi:hypothetical protein
VRLLQAAFGMPPAKAGGMRLFSTALQYGSSGKNTAVKERPQSLQPLLVVWFGGFNRILGLVV